MTDLSEADIEAARQKGRIEQLEERCKYFEDILNMATAARTRTERELGEVRHELRQANILADRYHDLMCTIVALAEGREDLPQEIALVVQEARAVADC